MHRGHRDTLPGAILGGISDVLLVERAWKWGSAVQSTTESEWVLPRDKTSPRTARRRLEESCANASLQHLDDASLLVSELVSNALMHGAGPVRLVLSRSDAGVRVGVEDESPELPVLRRTPDLEGRGRGMQLVAALADQWGVTDCPYGRPGKRVWFEIA